MPRGYNFRMNAHKKIDSKLKIGESKHAEKVRLRELHKQGKIENYNPSRVDGIYSIKTAETYRQSVDSFNKWLKDNNLSKEIRSPEDITKEVANKYLQQQQEQGRSIYTISKDMAALNKITDYKLNINKADAGIQSRSYENIQNNRIERDHHQKFNADNYQEGILLARAFGCRRESIENGQYQVKENSIYKDENNNIYLRLIEKGGLYREAQGLDQYKEKLEQTFKIEQGESMSKNEYVKSYYQDNNDYLVDKYTSKIPNHQYRAEYAQELYKQITESKEHQPGEQYRGYDSEALKEVSEALGHSRLDVVVYHYLR